MKASRFLLCRGILILAIALFSACRSNAILPQLVEVREGDQPPGSNPGQGKEDWSEGNGRQGRGIFWLRFHFRIPNNAPRPLGVQVIALGAYEAYWDGQALAKNGKVGESKGKELPGKHRLVLPLADSATQPGDHLLLLRVSDFYYQKERAYVNASLDNYPHQLTGPLKNALVMAVLAGVFVIGAGYYGIWYLNNRREPLFGIFAVISLLFFALICCEYLPVIWAYDYPVQLPRLEVISLLTMGISFAVPHFLNRQFRCFRSTVFNGLLAAVLLVVYFAYFGHYDEQAEMMGLVLGSVSLLLAGIAVYRRSPGAWVVLAAGIVSAILAAVLYFDYSLYLGFGLLLLAMLYLLALRSKAIEEAYRHSMVVSERLKTELLKKSIQPHFLMNTLTALIDWIEESPRAGVAMIGAIATELDLLARIAEKSVIPIAEELALCRCHLEVMHFRKGIRYEWYADEVAEEEWVPPAIFHTLLENGITHSRPNTDGSIGFRLQFENNGRIKRYTFTTLAVNRSPGTQQKGTGLRYVEARLTETYGTQWNLQSAAVPEGWQTVITLSQ